MATAAALTATMITWTNTLSEVGAVLVIGLAAWSLDWIPNALVGPFTSASSAVRTTPRTHLVSLARDLALATDGDSARGKVLDVPVHLRASPEGLHVRLDLDGHKLQLGPAAGGHRVGAWCLHSAPRTLDGLPHELLAARSSAGWAVWSGALSTVTAHPVSSSEVALTRVLDMIHLAAVLRGDGARFWHELARTETMHHDARVHALARVLDDPLHDDAARTWRAALDTDLRAEALDAARRPWGQRHRGVLRAEVDRGASLDTPHLLLALAEHATREDVSRLGDALQRAESIGARAALDALARLGDPDAIDAIDLARRRWTGPLAAAAAETRERLVTGARRRDGGRLTRPHESGALSLPTRGRDA